MANPNPDPLKARLGKKRRRQPGDLAEVRAIMWAALEAAEDLLTSEDEATKLRAVHAVSQAGTAYTKVVEVGELEARLQALEAAGPRLPGQGAA